MKKFIFLVALIAALGSTDTQAQYREDQTIWGATNDNTVYSDERGEYRWEMRERRVWVPERRTSGVFGIGSRTIPGHYEMRRERVKTYLRNDSQSNRKQHPHGMPPGQRKKMDNRYDPRYEGNRREDDRRYDDRRTDDRRYDDRKDDDRDDDRYERSGSSKGKGNSKGKKGGNY